MLNNNLSNWKNAWSRHPLRTEQNLSPLQLWVRGTHASGFLLDDPVDEVHLTVYLDEGWQPFGKSHVSG